MKIDLGFAMVLSFATTLLIGGAARAQSGTTTRVSVASGGAQGNGQTYGNLSVSGDGRYVAFCSTATNLLPGGTTSVGHLYVRDRQSGTTEIVSVSSAGVQGDNGSYPPSISADGRYVAFASLASNLVVGDANGGFTDIFLRDRLNGTTQLLSISSAGVQGDGYNPCISADGRYVAFVTSSALLVPGDTNGNQDVFVRDRVNGTTERVSTDSSGAEANGYSGLGTLSISADGRYVEFQSGATNLVPGDTNAHYDAFVKDRLTGVTERVSVDSSGVQGDLNSADYGVALSADGRYAAFTSSATNLVLGDTNSRVDVFVRDRLSGTTERVNLGPGGVEANGSSGSFGISISNNGRYVTFDSQSTNLYPGTQAQSDVYLRDRLTGTTELASVDSSGMPTFGHHNISSISGDGRFVGFQSTSGSLVPGDTNGVADVFIHDRGAPGPLTYCTAGTTTHGCTAQIAANLNPSATLANACNLTVTGVEGQKLGLLFYGINNSGFTPVSWGPGSTSLLCVKPPTKRTPAQISGGTSNACNGSYLLDWNAFQSANPFALGNPWSTGAKVYVQAWFRDPPAPTATNLSNAVEMTYVP